MWPARLAVTVALSLVALRAIGQRQLEQDAVHVALSHAILIALAVPDLDLVFDSGRIDQATQTELKRLRVLGDVFRFNLSTAPG